MSSVRAGVWGGLLRDVCLLQVLLDGDTDSYVIGGLRPASEYQVLLAAAYADRLESDAVVLLETTGRRTRAAARPPRPDRSLLCSRLDNHGCCDDRQRPR